MAFTIDDVKSVLLSGLDELTIKRIENDPMTNHLWQMLIRTTLHNLELEERIFKIRRE